MHLAAEYSANDSDLPDEPHEGEEGMSTAIIGMGIEARSAYTSRFLQSLVYRLSIARRNHKRGQSVAISY